MKTQVCVIAYAEPLAVSSSALRSMSQGSFLHERFCVEVFRLVDADFERRLPELIENDRHVRSALGAALTKASVYGHSQRTASRDVRRAISA
jgi:hypothetical protein